MHYDSVFHGGYRAARKATPAALRELATRGQAAKPVVFSNVVHSPPGASVRREGTKTALIARLVPARLKALFSFHVAEQEPSLLEFARRAKRIKS
jgi:hypothetical protein